MNLCPTHGTHCQTINKESREHTAPQLVLGTGQAEHHVPTGQGEIKMTDAEKLIQQFQEERDAHVREDIKTDNPYILSDLSQSQVVSPVAQIQ